MSIRVVRRADFVADWLPVQGGEGVGHANKSVYWPEDDTDALELFHIEFEPHSKVLPHSHPQDEILFVLRGELRFGPRVVVPGDALYIPGGTVYGFDVGPDGCEYVNFRASGG
jgi:quercetin dioxygenase-like cupin family protein